MHLQETLRLYPPVAVGQIRCNLYRDVVLAGRLTLPRGTAVWVPHGALHTAAFNWPDPDAFLPGRPNILVQDTGEDLAHRARRAVEFIMDPGLVTLL